MPVDGNACQRPVRFHDVRTQSNRIAPLRFCPVGVAQQVECEALLVMRHGVIGIILQHGLQRIDGVVGLAAAKLDLALVNLGVGITRPCLHDFIIQLASLVEPVLQDQQLDVILLGHHVLGVGLIQRGILVGGFVELVIGKIEIAKHAVAHGIIREILLRLTQEILGLTELVLGHVEAGERDRGVGIVRCGLNGAPEPLLSLGKSPASLVEVPQREQRVRGLGTQFDRFLETFLRVVPLLRAHLEHSQIQIGVGTDGIQLQRLLQVRQRGRGVIHASVVVGPRDVDVGVVGLLIHEQIEMLLGVIELTTEDQQIGHVKVRGILVGLELDGGRQFLIGGRPLLQLHRCQRHLVVGVGETRINLNGVLELNLRFPVLAFVEEALAALQVLLLADVRIPRAARQQRRQQANRRDRILQS